MLDPIQYDLLDNNSKKRLKKFLTRPKQDLNYINNQTPNQFICHSPAKRQPRACYSSPIHSSLLLRQLCEINYKQRINRAKLLLEIFTGLVIIIALSTYALAYKSTNPVDCNPNNIKP